MESTDVLNPELERRLRNGERGPYTARDYYALPEYGPRFQLIRGWLVQEPSPPETHQRALGNLYVSLRNWVDRHHLGRVYLAPFDTELSRHDIVQPDLLFVSVAKRSRITAKNVQGSPDLVVEILLPSTRKRDRTVKLDLYAEAGVAEAWLVDPESQSVEVVSLQETGRPVKRYEGADRPVSQVLGNLDFNAASVFDIRV